MIRWLGPSSKDTVVLLTGSVDTTIHKKMDIGYSILTINPDIVLISIILYTHMHASAALH